MPAAYHGGMHSNLALALCHAQHDEFDIVALCFQLPADGSIPEWVELIPNGPHVAGRDGREWLHDQPEAVVAALQTEAREGRDLVLDFEHSTEIKAPKGDKAPAAGWFKDFRLNSQGVIEGKLELNTAGEKSVEGKEYRYLSPALIFRKDNRRIVSISSVALTNKHNLHLQALNHQHQSFNGDTPMLKELLVLLGLAATTDEATALNSVKKLQGDLQTITTDRDKLKTDLETALNSASTPSLDKFVPRADYDKALERATNSESALNEHNEKQKKAEVEIEINSALQAGKITPASKDFYVTTCSQEGGLEKFKEFIKSAPKICEPTDLGNKQAPGSTTEMNSEAQQIADTFGNTAEDLKKVK